MANKVGIEEGKKEVARKMLEAGMHIDKVAELTDLPLYEIKKLQKPEG